MSENPCQPLQAGCEPGVVDRSIIDNDVRRLRWSLLGFGLFGFITPLVLASRIGFVNLDILAIMMGVTGATLNRQSFMTFPWTAIWCSLYPLIFVVGCLSPDAVDYRYWFIPSQRYGLPHVLYFALAVWACVNIGLIYRFHRIQMHSRGKVRPWQFSLRSLLGLTVLIAIGLSLLTWHHQSWQPPKWAGTEAVERKYARQLSKLQEYAYDEQRIWARDQRTHEYLDDFFGAEEIVDAVVWTASPDGHETNRVGMKLGGHPANYSSLTCGWVRSPRIDHPIVNFWNRRFVEYKSLLKDKNGVERGYSLTIDLSKWAEADRRN